VSDGRENEAADPFEVMALQLVDTVRAAARELPFHAGMALQFRPGDDPGDDR
jgi:hypothetical protein